MKTIFKTMIFSIVALTLLIVVMIKNNVQNDTTYNEKQIASEQNQEILDSGVYQETSTGDIGKMGAEEASNEIDKSLMESGIIDRDYRYTDSKKKNPFFEAITTNLRAGLPSAPDEYGIITKDFEVTAYQITQAFIINAEVSKEEAEQMRSNVKTEEYIKEQCAAIFSAGYQRANDTKVTQRMYDIDNELILEVTLDNSKCP